MYTGGAGRFGEGPQSVMSGVHVILVHSTGYAIKIEKVLKGAGIACKLIPVPRHLGSDCGVCVQFDSGQLEAVNQILEIKKLQFEGIYSI